MNTVRSRFWRVTLNNNARITVDLKRPLSQKVARSAIMRKLAHEFVIRKPGEVLSIEPVMY